MHSSIRSRRRSRNIESLEDRTLLTVQVVQIDSELLITSDASDSIAVRSIPGTPALVEIVGNGSAVPGLADIDASTVTKITVIGDDGNNSIDLSAVTMAAFSSSALELVVDGGDGDDTIIGAVDLPTTIRGDDGDDTITGGNLADLLDGGDGRDLINGGLGNDTINGDDGADVINGEGGDDLVNGGASADTIDGGVGIDILNGDTGNDSITGGLGSDTIDGGSDNDRLFGQEDNDSILGGGGNDLLEGDVGADTLEGQDGRDTLLGQADNDSLDGGRGADSVNGADGEDTANGGLGNDTVTGGDGNDTLFGGGGSDLMFGDGQTDPTLVGNDRMAGNSGSDSLFGGPGADFITGGQGDDLIVTNDTSLAVADFAVFEGNSMATTRAVFTVTLSSPVIQTVTVGYTVTADGTPTGGTATDGVDFLVPVPSGTLTFLPGQTTATVDVNIIGDDIDEADETLFITLTNSTVVGITDGSAEGRILDDDLPAPIDIFLVLDDTSSFSDVGPTINSAFTQIVSDLQAQFPNTELGFGVGRFEAYPGNSLLNRSYVLNQPIVSVNDPQFQQALSAALNRVILGATGRSRETVFEALFQIATGAGLDGNGDGDTVDDGPAGLFTTQTNLPISGDIPDYRTFVSDLTGDPNGPILPPTFPASMATDGVSFRPNARKIVLVATDAQRTVHEDDMNPTYFGADGSTVDAMDFANGASNGGFITTPGGRGAQIQATIDALLAENIQVIGLGDTFPNVRPFLRTELEDIALLTGALNTTSMTIENNFDTSTLDMDDIQPGEPLFFEVDTNNASELANSIVTAVSTVVVPAPPAARPPAVSEIGRDDTLLGGSENDTIFAAEGNDFIDGGDGNDSLSGGGGMDTLTSGEGDDTIDGGFGDDSVTGEEGDNVLGGGDGFDTIVIEPFADGGNVSTETSGADTVIVRGNDEANTFRVSQNSDDLMVVTTSTASIVISKNVRSVIIEGMGGDDVVTLGDDTVVPVVSGDINLIAPVGISIRLGDGNDTFDGRDGRLGLVPIEVLGGDGQDTITGSRGRDLIDGGGDGDLIDGARGNDTIQGGPGNDTIVGGRDDDVLQGGDGDDRLNGNIGNDVLSGGLGNDFLNGEDGADTIDGGIGSDTIFAGSGKDLITGGAGSDLIKGNSGNDTIFGQGGDDTINGNNGNDVINGGDGDDTIRGGGGNDLIAGADGADFINAMGGNDSVLGGDGSDTLFGGAGADVVLGGDGDDIVRGNGTSRDTVAGNEGDEDDLDDNRPAEINEAFTLSAQILSALDEPT